MAEVNELFAGWDEYPPTNLLVRALVVGFGGTVGPKVDPKVDAETFDAMQQAALREIAVKAGGAIPIIRGPDRGLPKNPIFDEAALRERNNVVALKLQSKANSGGR